MLCVPGRYITAGATELMLRSILNLEWMESAHKFRKNFGIDEDVR